MRQALKTLGNDLGVLKVNEEECESVSASGDAGIDLVSSFSFDDNATGAYAILGQCGAQETGWPSKTLEAHPIRLRNFYQMQMDCPNVMFVPVCYREATGAWRANHAANGALLIDRGRILSLVEQSCDAIFSAAWFLAFEREFAGVLPPD